MRIVLAATFLTSFHCFRFLTIIEANPIDENIHLRLYKNGYTDYDQAPISQGETLFQESKGYNQSLPIVLLIHGMATGADCYFVNGLVDAFVTRQLTKEYNIFAVDMPQLFENSIRNEFYIGILANVQPAGQMIGEFLNKVINLKLTAPGSINIIGYSMGAQVAGYAARIVKNNISEINFIAGLDPAGPGFHTRWGGHPTLVHVSAADAHTTHFYHTNSISCGTRDRVATADFVFNKGTIQPGCTKDAGLDCSHVRVPALYIEAVTNPKSFITRQCSNWIEFKACDCNNHETIAITFPADLSAKGIYYLRTHAKSPFSLGKRGSRCNKIVHKLNEIDSKENSKHDDISLHSRAISRIKNLRFPISPKHKLKDNINMHLINGIRKMEERHKDEVYGQLDPLNVDVRHEPKVKKESLDGKELDNRSAEIL